MEPVATIKPRGIAVGMANRSTNTNNSRLSLAQRLKGLAEEGLRSAEAFCRGATEITERVARSGVDTAQAALGTAQRKLGEDYYVILDQSPVVQSTLARVPLLDEKGLLGTAFNLSWTTSALWMATAGLTLARHHEVDRVLGRMFHYGPGHIARWNDVNHFMDSVTGSGHRLKSGHSIDYLPQIVEQFG